MARGTSAALAGRRRFWQDELEDWTVTESPLLNEWIEQAVEKTRLEQGREWVLAYLKVRFPTELTPEVIDTINQQPGAALLRSWYQGALEARFYDEFLAVVRPGT
jgi:hypothetical protein